MKLTIGKKILLGYIPVAVVILLITSMALYRLNKVQKLTDSIVNNEIKVRMLSEGLLENLRKREFDCRKALLYESDEMYLLVDKSGKKYQKDIQELLTLHTEGLGDTLFILNRAYDIVVSQCKLYSVNKDSVDYLRVNANREGLYTQQKEILVMLKKEAEENQRYKAGQTVKIVKRTFKNISIIAIVGITISLIVALIMIQLIRHSVRKLMKASVYVAEGEFHQLPTVKSNDELGDLSRAFNEMAHRLFLLEESYKDASPLTRLPGGIAIEGAVQQRIDKKVPFAFCMFDLDNFKPFNDRYGYSHGNTVIKKTAEIIQQVTREIGTSNDFVGHIGGDDFVVVATPENFEKICNTIIEEFDKEIVQFYEDADVKQGFIISKSRDGKTLKFPIMTISVSAVDSLRSELTNYIQVGEVIAELKKYAKNFDCSKFVIDRRDETWSHR